MLLELIPSLRNKVVILASSSPRRLEIFKVLELPFKICVSNFPENLDKSQYSSHPEKFVIDTAACKAEDVVKQLDQEPIDLIVSADTVVRLNGKFYEKPKDSAEAHSFLKSFSGQTVEVVTGVVILRKESNKLSRFDFFETTKVHFGQLTDSLISCYVATGEPLGKAGGFGIQGGGALLIDGISGDFYNVMGFPLRRFVTELTTIYSS